MQSWQYVTYIHHGRLIGSSVRTCQNKAKWSGEKVVCSPIPVCSHVSMLPIFNHGRLMGSSVRTCQNKAKWSGEEVVCSPGSMLPIFIMAG